MNGLLTARQVAERFNLSVGWIYSHAEGRHDPILPSIRLGHSLRFDPEEVEEFLQRQRKHIEKGEKLQ